MAKLHELLAAEKTPNGAWNTLREDTLKKFGNASHFFEGHSKVLAMIEEGPANKAIEDQAREEKPVTTNVLSTLEYAFDIFAKAEDLQAQKNATNQQAFGTVMWRGNQLLDPLPVDELLGLESRLGKIRELYVAIPTLDATKHWVSSAAGERIWETRFPEEQTKTQKMVTPVTLSPATDKHPANVQAVTSDVVVGKFSTTRRSGSATAIQKAEAIKRIDELIVEVKQARMRANETEVINVHVAAPIVKLLLEPFKDN